jgi:hypothetical protein
MADNNKAKPVTETLARRIVPASWRRPLAGTTVKARARLVSIPSRRGADAIAQAGHADHLGAVLAAEEGALLLEPVAHDADAAMLACRRQRMNGAFEAVEGVSGLAHRHLKRLVVIVSAGFTSGHDDLAPVVGPHAITRAGRPQFRRVNGTHAKQQTRSYPPPCGEGRERSERGGGRAMRREPRLTTTTPTPNPSPQGGGEPTEFVALRCSNHKGRWSSRGKPARESEPFAAPPRLTAKNPRAPAAQRGRLVGWVKCPLPSLPPL